MDRVMPIYPVTDLRGKAKQALAEAARQPVVITQNGRANAVLLSYTQYNLLVEQARELAQSKRAEREQWSMMSTESLARIWDNETDAIYDNWRELYAR